MYQVRYFLSTTRGIIATAAVAAAFSLGTPAHSADGDPVGQAGFFSVGKAVRAQYDVPGSTAHFDPWFSVSEHLDELRLTQRCALGKGDARLGDARRAGAWRGGEGTLYGNERQL